MNKVKAHEHRSCRSANQSVEGDVTKQTNHLPWILGRAGIIGLIGAVIYFITRKGENK